MTQIKLRRDTSANFTSKNPVLGVGEPAYETDTKKLKIGDGTTAYTQLEYFSAGGGGSTNITATLPLKIVDGVISLEVDGQTIQIVDGKLHANLDELSNTVNTLSDDVGTAFDLINIAQTDIQSNTENITNLQNALSSKEDKITTVAPIYKATTSRSPLKGFSFTNDNTGIYSTDGWGTSFNNGEEGYITVGSQYAGDISYPFTSESLKCYIAIPFVVGSILKYPNFNTNYNAVLLGYFNSDDTFIPVTNLYFCAGPTGIVPNNPSITTQYAGKQFQLQNSVKNPVAVSATRWTPSNASNISYVQLYQNADGSIGWSGSASNASGTERYSYYKESYYTTQDEIKAIKKITTAIIVPFHHAQNADYQYGTSTANAYPVANFGVYEEDRLMGRDFTNLAELTNNQFNIHTSQVTNLLGLNIGNGLSVVDGKLTSTGGGSNLRYPVEISGKSLMPSWYVVYNDGWCEQGGVFNTPKTDTAYTIKLLKTMANTNYSIQLTSTTNNKNSIIISVYTDTAKTTSSFLLQLANKYSNAGAPSVTYWQTCGYIN